MNKKAAIFLLALSGAGFAAGRMLALQASRNPLGGDGPSQAPTSSATPLSGAGATAHPAPNGRSARRDGEFFAEIYSDAYWQKLSSRDLEDLLGRFRAPATVQARSHPHHSAGPERTQLGILRAMRKHHLKNDRSPPHAEILLPFHLDLARNHPHWAIRREAFLNLQRVYRPATEEERDDLIASIDPRILVMSELSDPELVDRILAGNFDD